MVQAFKGHSVLDGLTCCNCTICCIFEERMRKKSRSIKSCWKDENSNKKDDLFWCLRYFLRFGKCCGVVPFDGIFSGRLEDLKMRWLSPGSIYSLVVLFLMTFNMTIGFLGLMVHGGSNATEWAWSAESFIFYSMACFIHLYFLTRGRKLINILRLWPSFSSSLEFSEQDMKLSRDVNLIAGLILTSAILENALLQVIFSVFPDPMDPKALGFILDKSALMLYFERAQNHWSSFVPYNEVWPILIFFCNKFALYAWNFVDILIILMSRAIYHKIEVLNEIGRQKLIPKIPSEKYEITILRKWETFMKEYDMICVILKAFEDFLSPLVLASFGINCFYICLQLHLGLTSSSDIKASVPQRAYAIWSFLHLIFRMFLVSVNAARINDHAKTGTLDLLYCCPEQYETKTMERMRFKISSSEPGLTGLRCFVITRPFMLRVLSVIFTIEIVLLQAPGPEAGLFHRNTTANFGTRLQ